MRMSSASIPSRLEASEVEKAAETAAFVAGSPKASTTLAAAVPSMVNTRNPANVAVSVAFVPLALRRRPSPGRSAISAVALPTEVGAAVVVEIVSVGKTGDCAKALCLHSSGSKT